MKESTKITRKVWVWPTSHSPWFFVYIGGREEARILQSAQKHHMGMIRVRAQLGNTVWETSLFPHTKEKCYIMPIKKSVRVSEGIFDKDTVTLIITPIHKAKLRENNTKE